MTVSGSTWTLTDHNDTVEVYTDNGSGEGVLNTITLRNGYQQTMAYTSGVLTSVTDSYSRSLSLSYTSGLLTSVSTPDSLVVSYSYTYVGNPYGYFSGNAGNLLTKVSYNTSPVTSQTYAYSTSSEFPHEITSITDENGNTSASWQYDGAGQANWSKQGGGLSANYTSFSYSGGTTTTVTNAYNVNDTYTFSISQGVPKLTEIDRAATSGSGATAAAHKYYTYDASGFVNDVKDWNSNETTITNDSHGDPTSITEAYGTAVARTTTIAYNATWVHEPDTITTTGDTITFTYDGSGNPLTRTDTDTTSNLTPYSTNGQTRVTTWTWNGTGELTSVTLPRTDVTAETTFGYTSGVLTSITDALSNAWSITSYTGGGYPETIVDPNSVTTTLGYDTRLNLNTRTVDPSGGDFVTTYTHDPANNLTAVELPDGATWTLTLDGANRLTNITDLSSHSINYTLDELGDRTATTAATGYSTKYSHSATFDNLGRMLTDVGASSQTTTYTYDPNSNVLTVAPPSPSGTITYTYDALNRVATRVDPSPGGTTTFTYDVHNRLTNVQDANGNSTAYVYDGFGDVTQITSPDTGTTVYHYDKDRNLTQKVFAGGQTVNFTYDADDRNLTIAYPSDSSLNVSKTYDQAGHGYGVGRLTSVTDQAGSDSFTYDKRGNRTAESRVITSVGTLSTSTTFDAAGRVSGITYPSGTVVAYTRNSTGQVTGVTAKPPGAMSASNIATSITYEPFGPVTGLTFGNGITGTYAFNSDYRATSREDTTGTDVMNLAYAYKTNGSLYTITDSVNAANSQTLGYDALDRLTSATSGMGGYGTYGWTWDAVNNVATQVINSVTTTFSLNSNTNQLSQFVTGATTTTVDTTANGNILDLKISGTPILTYTFNQANQPATATTTTTASYKYGFDGKRLEKAPYGGYPIVYQYAGSLLLSENDLHSGQTADYIYLNGMPIGEVDPTSGDIYFMHTDRQGTPQYVTDSTPSVVWGAVYNPFGDNPVAGISGTLATQGLRLPGQYFDPESGNNHNGFRDYAGSLTRYTESDPIGLGGGMNTYQYVLGNLSKYTDVWGLDPGRGSGGAGSGPTPPPPPPPGSGGSKTNCSNSGFSFIASACAAESGGGGNSPNCTPGDPNCSGNGGFGGGPRKCDMLTDPTCSAGELVANEFCGHSKGDAVLSSVIDGAKVGAASGAIAGAVTGTIFGGELTGPLSGFIAGSAGALIGGADGAIDGLISGMGTAAACDAVGIYNRF